MSDDQQIDEFRQQALDYHANPSLEKIEIALTKSADSALTSPLHTSLVWLSQCVKSHKTLKMFISTQPKATWLRSSLTVLRFWG